MKKVMISFLALTLLTPALSSAHHVDWKPPTAGTRGEAGNRRRPGITIGDPLNRAVW